MYILLKVNENIHHIYIYILCHICIYISINDSNSIYNCETVVEVSKGMFPVKIFLQTKPLFVSVEFHGDHTADTMMR